MAAYTIRLAVARQPVSPLVSARRDIQMAQRDAARVVLTIYDQDGDAAPINVTGAAAVMTLWRHGDNRAALRVGGLVLDPASNGQIAFDFTRAMTAALDGRFAWSIEANTGDGAVVAHGGINIRGTVDGGLEGGVAPPPTITISIDSVTIYLPAPPPPDPDPDPDPDHITWLRADGGVLRDEDDVIWRPKLVNWYGFEQIFMPGGLWGRPYKTVTIAGVVHEGIMDQAKRLGFNGFRLPLCQDLTWAGTKPVTSFGQWNSTYIHPDLNPDLFATPPEPGVSPQPVKTGIQIMDAVVAHAKALGMRIMLDMHCLAPDDDNVLGTGGKWYSTTTPDGTGATAGIRREPRSEAQAIAAWEFLAARYADEPVVFGFDIINEPHACTWGDDDPDLDVRAYYERAGEAIHAINDKVLIVCEGIAGNVDFAQEGEDGSEGQFTWGTIWSGNLTFAADHPVELTTPERVVYSPHEYGSQFPGSPAIAHQWFEDPRFPEYMRHVWNVQWGYLAEEDIAPLIIGEVGAEITVGVNAYTAEQRALDFQWLTMLGNYSREFSIGFAWWALNPGGFPSGLLNQTTGGVWTEAPADKMTFVDLLLDDANPTPSLGALTLSQGGGLLLSGDTGYLLVSGG